MNLAKFYEEELRQVLKGVKVTKVFNLRERNKLRSAEILSLKNCDWFLALKVKEILQA